CSRVWRALTHRRSITRQAFTDDNRPRCMNDRRRPTRRGRGHRPQNRAPLETVPDPSPYREDAPTPAVGDGEPVVTTTGSEGGSDSSSSPPQAQPTSGQQA